MDKLVCKCGARTYREHLKSGTTEHVYRPDKAASQVRK